MMETPPTTAPGLEVGTQDNQTAAELTSRPSRRWRWALRLAGLLAVPALFLGWSLARYGSVAVGYAALRGTPIALSPSALGLGTIRAGERGQTTVAVWNLTSSDGSRSRPRPGQGRWA
jgi:hypothetical protein